ncbi:hypothetical protein QMO56_11270 [Roseomonas sp. E05]|uniref:hypothetical protein n=1 Tax=Roseomonas sp. E05 TaxID=3046310 RepID=UPI0024BB165D|nr:hypothetical protein [Roseomonas sp. E05]MDJ0388693.1 hypothetical protein [Roseomonas sp. E05]
MAWYKDASKLSQNHHANFDKIWKPGETPPDNGIYQCQGCGDEIASNKGVQLPSQNHRQHSQDQGAIRWKMIVCCVNR